MKDNLHPLNLLRRAISPTPGFFGKLKWIGAAVGAVGACILSLSGSGALPMPESIVTAGTVLTTIGGTVVSIAQLPTQSSTKSE